MQTAVMQPDHIQVHNVDAQDRPTYCYKTDAQKYVPYFICLIQMDKQYKPWK